MISCYYVGPETAVMPDLSYSFLYIFFLTVAVIANYNVLIWFYLGK